MAEIFIRTATAVAIVCLLVFALSPPPFEPPDIPGLETWWSAEDGVRVGGPIIADTNNVRIFFPRVSPRPPDTTFIWRNKASMWGRP